MRNHDKLLVMLMEKLSGELLEFEKDTESQPEWYVYAINAKYHFMVAAYIEFPMFVLRDEEILCLLEMNDLLQTLWECCCDAQFTDSVAEIIERFVDAAMGRFD